ncbi:unnamed protein product [Ectocarpus sp. 8 AP-2014]
MTEYAGTNSPSEVNLSDKERKETEARVAAVLDQVCLLLFMDRDCLDGAYNAILAMLRADNYARYKDFIVAQRHLRVARLEALWWMQVCWGEIGLRFLSIPKPQLLPAISFLSPLVA